MWHDCGPRVLGIYFEPVRAEKIKQIAMSKDKETKKSEQEEVKEQPADAAGNGPQEATEGTGVKMAEEEAEKDSAAVKMAEEAAQWRDKYVRLSAEFDNYRKRTLKEKMDLISSAGEDVIKALLPVVVAVSQATRLMGSCAKRASRIASEMASHILSGCPSVTDSDVNNLLSMFSSLDNACLYFLFCPVYHIRKGPHKRTNLSIIVNPLIVRYYSLRLAPSSEGLP